jgi:hypothetical protein
MMDRVVEFIVFVCKINSKESGDLRRREEF